MKSGFHPVPIAMDAVEEFNEFDGLDNKAGLFEYFAGHRLAQGLSDIDQPAGNGPLAFGGLCAALHQQNAPLLDDHRTHADQRCYWKFSLQLLPRFIMFAVSAIRGIMIVA